MNCPSEECKLRTLEETQPWLKEAIEEYWWATKQRVSISGCEQRKASMMKMSAVVKGIQKRHILTNKHTRASKIRWWQKKFWIDWAAWYKSGIIILELWPQNPERREIVGWSKHESPP